MIQRNTQQQPAMVRRLKVHNKVLFRKARRFQYQSLTIQLPQILLRGKWLEAMGFSSGHMLEVTCEHQKLTIRVSAE